MPFTTPCSRPVGKNQNDAAAPLAPYRRLHLPAHERADVPESVVLAARPAQPTEYPEPNYTGNRRNVRVPWTEGEGLEGK